MSNHIIDNARWQSLPIGICDFEHVVKHYVYVDKSTAIGTLIAHGGATLLCRPRLFGKTLFVSMLQCYFEKSVESYVSERRHLFASLQVASLGDRFTKHCGAHPVIRLSLSAIPQDCWENALPALKSCIAHEYERHRYVLGSGNMSSISEERYRRIMSCDADLSELSDSLSQLSKILRDYHCERTVILIDDIDMACPRSASDDAKQIRSFMHSWLASALRDMSSVELALMTCTQPPQRGILAPLPPHVTLDTPLDTRLGITLGFSMAEAEALASHIDKHNRFEEAQHWYKGYAVGTSRTFCPWSYLNFLHEGIAQPYWTCTDKNSLVRNTVLQADEPMESDLRLLAEGESVVHALDPFGHQHGTTQNHEDVWTQLYLGGYVTTNDVHMPNETSQKRRLYIPNLEIARLFQRELLFRAAWTAGSDNRLQAIQNALTQPDDLALERELCDALRYSPSFSDADGRAGYRLRMLFMLYGIKGYQLPEIVAPTNQCKAGILVRPDDSHADSLPALAIEIRAPHHCEDCALSLQELRKHAKTAALAEAVGRHLERTTQCRGVIAWGISILGFRAACACQRVP